MDDTENNETTEEKDIQNEDGTTADEAHRVGEFDDLRDRIEALSSKIDDMIKTLTVFVSSNRTGDDEDDEPDDVDDLVDSDIDELDLSI